jgi:SAM-dependent methyltransferase
MADGAAMTEKRSGQVRTLIEAAWVASALVAVLEQPGRPDGDPAAEVLAAAGLAEWTPGGWALTPEMAAEAEGQPVSAAASIRSALGQAAAITAGGADWTRYDKSVLLAQGKMSAPGGHGLANLIRSVPELSAAFEQQGVFLDVGVGVAGLACVFCEAVPGARVIGLDVHAPALALARAAIAEKGLEPRIELRLQAVQDLRDSEAADLAHISPPFISPSVLGEALARLHRALKPGGWLALSGLTTEGPAGAIGRWQAINAGGSAVTGQECAELLKIAGFEPPARQALPPGAPVVLVCRRP